MNDLTITLDTMSKIPMYEQIYQYIKQDIQKGNLVLGQRLPSSRKLAKYLEISRSTVELAYEQLTSEGYVEAIPCKGIYVAKVEELYKLNNLSAQQSTEEFIQNVQLEQRMDYSDLEMKTNKQYQFDFTPNGIDSRCFPYNTWRKITKNTLLENEQELFLLGNPQGEYQFRVTICKYLHQARGMNCRPEDIIIGAGNEYLLMLLSIIMGQKRSIAFENPSYERAYSIFHNLSHDVYAVNMDKKGMRVDELEALGVDLAYVMPSHQFPMGVVMPINRRMELLQWAAAKENRYIIEDDYDSEFRYKGKPIPALQGVDQQDKVIYLGTFSKSIAPAIRMSYMVLPKVLMRQYQSKCQTVSSTVSKIDQMIVNAYIEGGYYERHLNKSRAMYKSKHDVLIQMLKPIIATGMVKIWGENAGVHILLDWDARIEEEHLITLAEEVDVKVYGLSKFYRGKPAHRHHIIMLGYAKLSEVEIQEAVTLLVTAWLPYIEQVKQS